MDYHHTQRAPLHWILHGVAGAILLWAAVEPQAQISFFLCVMSGIVALFGLMFATMTVQDDGTSLGIYYGPLPVFRHHIRYTDMASAEIDRTTWLDGWGIHWVPGRGWTYNLWGFGCVRLEVNGRTIRVGTDDQTNLLEFLSTKIRRAQQEEG